MEDYPQNIVPVNHVEPVPRRVRAYLAGEKVLDTTRARYVWEWAGYPEYYIPADDVRADLLVSRQHSQQTRRGRVQLQDLQVRDTYRPSAAKLLLETDIEDLRDTLRFDWDALDAWYEEDEQVFVHPRNPYARVDSLRSTRSVRIELDGLVLAESTSPVLVFETGLPTRYYVNRTDVDFGHLLHTDTVTQCPYKGTTSDYWSVRVGEVIHPDLAWSYNFPTCELLPIAGLIAFYNEKVDTVLDGTRLDRPVTHFSS